MDRSCAGGRSAFTAVARRVEPWNRLASLRRDRIAGSGTPRARGPAAGKGADLVHVGSGAQAVAGPRLAPLGHGPRDQQHDPRAATTFTAATRRRPASASVISAFPRAATSALRSVAGSATARTRTGSTSTSTTRASTGGASRPSASIRSNVRRAQELVDLFVAAGATTVYVGPNLPLDRPSPTSSHPLVNHDNHLHASFPP